MQHMADCYKVLFADIIVTPHCQFINVYTYQIVMNLSEITAVGAVEESDERGSSVVRRPIEIMSN